MARTRPNHPHRRGGGDGVLTRLVRAAAHAAQRRPKTMIALWLALVAGCAFAGTATGTKTLTEAQSGTGQSAQADARVEQAHLQQPADENVLVRSGDPAATRAAAQALTVRLRALPEVAAVRGPADTAMWHDDVPPINASRRLSVAGVGAFPSSRAPSNPRPPAWASMIDPPTGVPGSSPSSRAARRVSPWPIGSPIGRTFWPMRRNFSSARSPSPIFRKYPASHPAPSMPRWPR